MIGDCLLFRAQLHRQVAEKLCAEFAYNHSVQKPLVPSRVVLEFGDAISGISRVSGQAARSIG